MRNAWRIVVLLAALAVGAGAATSASESAAVRVRLASWGAPASVTVRGAALVARRTSARETLRLPDRVREVVVRADGDDVLLLVDGQERPAGAAVEITAREGDVTLAAGRREAVYPGALQVEARGGRLRLANLAPFERYIEGVLSAEVPALFPEEARRAAAVATRSFTLTRAATTRDGLCDTARSQVYPGVGNVAPAHAEAVTATRGEFALFAEAPIEAVYSSDCGGWTADNEEAWPGHAPAPYLRGRPDVARTHADPFCAANRSHEWKATLSAERLRAISGSAGPPRIAVLERSPSGRISRLRVGDRELTGAAFRAAAGASVVRSVQFEVRNSAAGVELAGRGSGHGVGLCQFGASGMARAGYGYREILAHYYAGVEVGALPQPLSAYLGDAPLVARR